MTPPKPSSRTNSHESVPILPKSVQDLVQPSKPTYIPKHNSTNLSSSPSSSRLHAPPPHSSSHSPSHSPSHSTSSSYEGNSYLPKVGSNLAKHTSGNNNSSNIDSSRNGEYGCGSHYDNNNVPAPLSPKCSSNIYSHENNNSNNNSNNEFDPTSYETDNGLTSSLPYPNESNELDEPNEQTALLSFPTPSFEAQAQHNEENHNIWDVLCHSIETLASGGTVGTVGAVIVLVFLISAAAKLIPLFMGVGDGRGNGNGNNSGNGGGGGRYGGEIPGNQTTDVGLGGPNGFLKSIGTSFVTALRQAAVVNLTSVDFGGINEGNVQFHVAANLVMNYSRVENRKLGWILQALAFPIYSFGIRSMSATLYINNSSTSATHEALYNPFESTWSSSDISGFVPKNGYTHSGDKNDGYEQALTVSIPSIENIKTRQNQRTDINLVANISNFDNPVLLSDTIRRLLAGSPVTVKVLAEAEPYKGFLSIGKLPVVVETSILLKNGSKTPSSGLLDEMFANKVKVCEIILDPVTLKKNNEEKLDNSDKDDDDKQDDDLSAIHVEASVMLKDALETALSTFNFSQEVLQKVPVNLNISIPRMEWEVAIPGCKYDGEHKDDVLHLTKLTTLPFDLLQPNNELFLNDDNNGGNSDDKNSSSFIKISSEAYVTRLSPEISIPCQGSNHSALDSFLQQYLSGQKAHLVVKGAAVSEQNKEIPEWAAHLLSKVEVAVPVLGRHHGKSTSNSLTKSAFKRVSKGNPKSISKGVSKRSFYVKDNQDNNGDGDNNNDEEDEKLVKQISFSNLKISLPPPKSPFDRPGSPDSPPKISAHVEVTLHPPSVLNITKDLGLAVSKVRGPVDLVDATSGVLFAKFNVSDWVDCVTVTKPDLDEKKSFKSEIKFPEYNNGDNNDGDHDGNNNGGGHDGNDQPNPKLPLLDYVVSFDIYRLPMTVVDQKTLSSVATQLVLKSEALLGFDSVVDLEMETTVGNFSLNKIPVEGSTTMKA